MRHDQKFYRPSEVDLLIGDASKARETLGWVPEVDFTIRPTVVALVDEWLEERAGLETTFEQMTRLMDVPGGEVDAAHAGVDRGRLGGGDHAVPLPSPGVDAGAISSLLGTILARTMSRRQSMSACSCSSSRRCSTVRQHYFPPGR